MADWEEIEHITPMAPPSFNDLNKSVKDLFDKNFTLNKIKFKHSGKTESGVNIAVDGSHDLEKPNTEGSVEAKYKFPELSSTLSTKWSSGSTLLTTLVVEDKPVKALKSTVEATLDPNSGKKSVKTKFNFKNCFANANTDLVFASLQPTVNASCVFGGERTQNIYFGAQAAFDTVKSQLTKVQYGASFERKGLVLSGILTNNSQVECGAFHEVNSDAKVGVLANYDFTSKQPKFALATQHSVGSNGDFMKAKIDTSTIAHLAYVLKLSRGFKLGVSGQVNMKDPNSGRHRIGLNLEFEQ